MIPDMIKRVRWLLARSLRRDDFSRAALSDQVTGANEFRFDAFISYSHAADGKLAAALQHGLRRFAKPLFKFKRWSINSRGPSDSDKKATRRVVSRGELRDRKAVIFRGVRVRAFHRAVGDGAAKLIGKGRTLTSLVKRHDPEASGIDGKSLWRPNHKHPFVDRKQCTNDIRNRKVSN
jgi:hypothetical protein